MAIGDPRAAGRADPLFLRVIQTPESPGVKPGDTFLSGVGSIFDSITGGLAQVGDVLTSGINSATAVKRAITDFNNPGAHHLPPSSIRNAGANDAPRYPGMEQTRGVLSDEYIPGIPNVVLFTAGGFVALALLLRK